MGLFGSSTDVSSAQSTAQSGLGAFKPKNTITYSKPLIDITKPLNLIGLAVVLGAGWYAWKRFK